MNQSFTFSDLCAGIGGFRLGLESIGGNCIYSAEFNGDCEKTYFTNYGDNFDLKMLLKLKLVHFQM